MDICGHREERFLFTLLPRNVLILVCLGMFADIMNVCECEERSFRLLPQNILILICLGIFADITNVLLGYCLKKKKGFCEVCEYLWTSWRTFF